METRKNERTIDIWELLQSFLKYKWIIVITAIGCMMLSAVYTIFFVDDTYTANTRMYVLNQSSEVFISSSDYSVSSYLIKDYEVLITGRNVMDEVRSRLNLEMSAEELASMISAKAVDNTRVLQISVTDTDPQRAADIANCVYAVASEQMKEIVNVETVHLVYEAEAPQNKSGPNLVRNVALVTMFGTVLCLCILTVIHVLNEKSVQEKT